MTAIELKFKINEALEEIPENALPEILNILSEFRHKAAEHKKLTDQFQKILLEDKELLHKLAQ